MKSETKEKGLIVGTQHLENYNLDGGNHWKFKGGKEYVIKYNTETLIYEENAYGEGVHSYYDSPDVSPATIIALINRLGHASCSDFQTFVVDWKVTDFPDSHTEEEQKWLGEPEAMKLFEATRMTWQELEQQVLEMEKEKCQG